MFNAGDILVCAECAAEHVCTREDSTIVRDSSLVYFVDGEVKNLFVHIGILYHLRWAYDAQDHLCYCPLHRRSGDHV